MVERPTRAQAEITRVVMGVVADEGFVMAGGLALNEWGFSQRPTEDLDTLSDRCADARTVITANSRRRVITTGVQRARGADSDVYV